MLTFLIRSRQESANILFTHKNKLIYISGSPLWTLIF